MDDRRSEDDEPYDCSQDQWEEYLREEEEKDKRLQEERRQKTLEEGTKDMDS